MKIDQKERNNGLAQSHQRPKNTLGAYVNDHQKFVHQTPVMHSRNMRSINNISALPGPSASTDRKMAETWKMKDSSVSKGATPDKDGSTPLSTTTPKEARHTLHTFDAVPLYDPVK